MKRKLINNLNPVLISVVSIIFILGTTVCLIYFTIEPPKGNPELIIIDIEAIPETNSIFVSIWNAGCCRGIIMNITQIKLSNSTILLNPIDVLNNESVSQEFPIEIEMLEILNITCVFNTHLTLLTNYTLSIFYDAGKSEEIEFIYIWYSG